MQADKIRASANMVCGKWWLTEVIDLCWLKNYNVYRDYKEHMSLYNLKLLVGLLAA